MISTRRKGIAATEAALILPIFFVFIFGTIEACQVIFFKQSLKIAAFEGARVSIVPGADSGNVEAQVNEFLTSRGLTPNSVSVSPANFASMPANTLVTVSVEADLASNGMISSRFFIQPTMTESVTILKEFD